VGRSGGIEALYICSVGKNRIKPNQTKSNQTKLNQPLNTHDIRALFFPNTLTHLGALPTDAAGQLNVPRQDSHALGVDGAEVGVLKQAHHVRLGRILESKDGRGLEAEIRPEVLGQLTHKALEGELAKEETGRLLVPTDLTEGDSARAIATDLLGRLKSRSTLPGALQRQELARRLAALVLAGMMTAACHGLEQMGRALGGNTL